MIRCIEFLIFHFMAIFAFLLLVIIANRPELVAMDVSNSIVSDQTIPTPKTYVTSNFQKES